MPSPYRISLILIGAGNVGRAFLRQHARVRHTLAARYGTELVPVALADSSGALINPAGLGDSLIATLEARPGTQRVASLPGALPRIEGIDLVRQVSGLGINRAILVDTSTAAGMVPALHRALDAGYGIVLANKRPLTGPWGSTRRFFETSNARFEATVGAGLPIVSTLRYLMDTGDEILAIEGALSRTLAYICTRMEEGEPLSAAVASAQRSGMTEPDPRDDLSGMDVARKALILARLAGWPLELDQIEVDSLYPNEMAHLSLGAFMNGLGRLDAEFNDYMRAVSGPPRYMADIRPEGAAVGLRAVNERLHAQLRGPINQIAITSERYREHALTLAGPGAGVEVTAAAVLQDCMSLALTLARG